MFISRKFGGAELVVFGGAKLATWEGLAPQTPPCPRPWLLLQNTLLRS